MGWIWLLLAGTAEVISVILMKESAGFSRYRPASACFAAMAASLGLLSLSLDSIPVGTAYVVWTGIGASGSMIVGIVWYGESRSKAKLASIALILIGIAGLKLTS